MLKRFLGGAALAIAAVFVALTTAPGAAQAQTGSSFCVDFDGVIVSPGELVRRVDGRNHRAVYTSVYLCREDGSLGHLYTYCTGPECSWRDGRPPILVFEPVVG